MRAPWIGTALLATAVLGVLGWQWHAGQHLHAEVAELRSSVTREGAQIAVEKGRLATPPSAVEVTARRAEHAALAKLRSELSDLNARTEQRLAAPNAFAPAAMPLPPEGPLRRAEEWSNAGRASAIDLLETITWAARNNDLDTIADRVMLETTGYRAIAEALATLSEAERREMRSPYRFVAQELARDFALSAYRVKTQRQNSPQSEVLTTTLYAADGSGRDVSLIFTQPDDRGWSLVVPRDVSLHYLKRLKPVEHVSK